jgi:tetratricopeptide (TPR) repeat protein/S1-C subfamily serine protease
MKIHNLLAILTISTFTVSAMLPRMAVAQEATGTTDENGVLTLATAQQTAAKITVRIRVGQGGGSGVLLAKKGGTYLVLTNAHVVQGQGVVSITTPDGQVHGARRVKNAQVGDFDLALLEFNSARAYDLAKFANFANRDAALKEGRELFAAGFPYDANGLKLLGGKITQLPQEAFKNGTQVGYVTQGDLVQGMSGGPVLDSFGNLVGINSTLARPVIDSYVYADGSKAPDDKVAEYRQANWSVPMYNLLTRLNPDVLYSYQQLPKLHRSVTPTGYMAELDRKARAVTVRIEKSNGGNGSGVIVARDGDSYYVLTADHVVANSSKLKVVTHDQRIYQISAVDVKRSEGTDLAVVKFTSNQNYRSATLGNYSIVDGLIVFPGGWPAPKYINSQQWQWQINPGLMSSKELGEFQTQSKLSFSNGYDLIYNSKTYGGMSGGPVFDHAGRVIGIHGRAEAVNGNILGNSLGISIGTFIGLAERLNIKQQNLQVTTTPPSSLTSKRVESINLILNNIATPNNNSDVKQWLEYGNQLYRLGKNTAAVKAFDRAIALRPNLPDSHYGKGLVLWNQGNSNAALASFDQAITLVPSGNKSNYYYLWKYRTAALLDLQRYSEALAAVSQAIDLDSQDITIISQKAATLSNLQRYTEAVRIYDDLIKRGRKSWDYYNRGVAKYALGDRKGALSDYNQAISINPQYAIAYNNRGIAKYALGDRKGAILDYDQAININPQFVVAYANRGGAKSDLGDRKGAMIDYDRAISINPQFDKAYYNRGNTKYALGDNRGAMIDYDRAISINPQFAIAYANRGNTKSDLGDNRGAMLDYDRAISINPQLAMAYANRGNTKSDLGDNRGAMLDYDRAISINPQLAIAYYSRGGAKYELGDKKGAILDYDRAIIIKPKFVEAYYSRGVVKSSSGDNGGAMIDYDRAIIIKPKFSIAYNNRGLAKYELGDKKGAMSDFDRAIIIKPKFIQAYNNRGNTKSALGDKQGAILDFDKAISIDPQNAGAYNNRGNTKSALGDKQGAILDFNKAISIDPQDAGAYNNRGNTKSALGDKQGAIEDFKIAAQLFKVQNNQELYNRAIELIQKISTP